MKHRTQHIPAFLTTLTALTFASSTAWACGGHVVTIAWMPMFTLPYTVFGSIVIAARAHRWFDNGRRLGRWFDASFGAGVVATIGGLAAYGIIATELGSENFNDVVMVSTPLVFQVAYLSWLGSRGRRRRLAKEQQQ